MPHQDYDKIFKENIAKIADILLAKVCKLELENIESVKTTVPRTIERRADVLKMATDKRTGEKKLVHLELQSSNDPNMPWRMLVYKGLFYEIYQLPIEQYVIFLGAGKPTMQTEISLPDLWFRYHIIAINTIDYETFINSDEPEEIILAILADFKNKDKKLVIQQILNNLNEKTKNTKKSTKLNKYIFQLEILGNLRSLQSEITYQINNMTLDYDVRQDLRYLQGVEEATVKTVKKLLSKGILTPIEIAEFVEMPLDFVLNIQNEMQK